MRISGGTAQGRESFHLVDGGAQVRGHRLHRGNATLLEVELVPPRRRRVLQSLPSSARDEKMGHINDRFSLPPIAGLVHVFG